MVVWESSESGSGWWGFLTTEDRHVATGLEGVGFIKAGVEIFRRIRGSSGDGRRVDLVARHTGNVIKILFFLNINGVLSAAILPTITKKDAGFKRLDPCVVGAVRNQIGFAREL